MANIQIQSAMWILLLRTKTANCRIVRLSQDMQRPMSRLLGFSAILLLGYPQEGRAKSKICPIPLVLCLVPLLLSILYSIAKDHRGRVDGQDATAYKLALLSDLWFTFLSKNMCIEGRLIGSCVPSPLARMNTALLSSASLFPGLLDGNCSKND